MTGKKKKFSYYNDYSTVNFGGSSSRKRERSNEGRSRSGREHNWCADCSGSGECSHCKGGFYPRRDGSNAPCGKCRGGQKCHACRGSRLDGKKCGTPTYEESKEKTDRARASRLAKGLTTAAFGIAEMVASPGLAGGALPGQQDGVRDLAEGWKDSARMEQRDQQTRGLRRSTRDKGARDRGSGQQ